MKLHKTFFILFLVIFFNFCSNENLNTEISLNDCVKNILSPTDYEKFLNNEITLGPYQELIDDCLAGNLEISSISNTEAEANKVENEETTTTSTTEIKTNKSVVGFTTEATNASEKWPMIYNFENISDISESHKVAKTSTTINSSRVENLQLVFNNCESNVINLDTVDINQNQEIIIVNEDCRQGITINSFKHLILSNLNFEIKLFKNGKFENLTTGESGCCHTLNIEELISSHTSYINTFFNTTTTTTTTIPYPPTAEIKVCPDTSENNVTLSFPFIVNAPSSKVTSIRIKTFLNGSVSGEVYLENNPTIELTQKNQFTEYTYEFEIPNTNLNSGIFEIYVRNERGQETTVQCSFNIFVPDRSAPGPFGTVLMRPVEMDRYDGYTTFEATTQLLNDDIIKRYTYKLISNEFNDEIFKCEVSFSSGKEIKYGTELYCSKYMRLFSSSFPSYVSYSQRDDSGLSSNNVGWYRLELEVEDMAGNIGLYKSCQALRVYQIWSYYPKFSMSPLNQSYNDCS